MTLFPASVPALAVIAGASDASTRRALRRVAAAGRVVCLGYGVRRGQWWGRPDDVREQRAVRDSLQAVGRLMGPCFARSLRRAVVAIL